MSVISANCLSAVEAARAIRQGVLTATQLVEACLSRIAQREGDIHAWAAIDPHAALAAARQCDREPARSLLHGVPIGIKDVIDTAGLPTEYNSPIFRGHRPQRDADVVVRARAAGLVVIGKTVTTEFATRGRLGPTRNPVNSLYSPGGSSSGSAAAVADFMVPLAISTQTAGSIIRPASYCGVVGFKPTSGAIPGHGMKPIAPSLDTIGVHARTTADALAAFSILTGAAVSDVPGKPIGKPRLGLCRTPFWDVVDEAVKQAIEETAALLMAAGYTLKQITLPDVFNQVWAAQDVVSDYEACQSLAFERSEHWDQLSSGVRHKLNKGARITESMYRNAKCNIENGRRQCVDLFLRCDYMLTPSAPGLAPLFSLQDTGDALFNKPWTALGLPCVNIPIFPSEDGLPIGIQLVGPAGRDASTLHCAGLIERLLEQHITSFT